MSKVGDNATPLDELSDEALVSLAVRETSDGPAFVALVRRHRDRVWRVCYRLLGNEHDAHDAAPEVFVRLFTHLHKFEGRSKFSTWLHGMALRTCLGLRRSRSRRQRRETTATVDAAAQVAAAQGPATKLSPEVEELLESLDEEDRAMVILKYAEEYTFEELAEMFDLSTSACKMRVSRARQRLVAQHGNDES